MKIISRAALGWPESAAPLQATARGVKIHYEGTPVSTGLLADHGACLREWKAIRASHLANTAEGYSDVAYNYGACPHGYLLEGRGLGRRTGANGNQTLNAAHYAIVGLVGDSGLTEPTPEMLHAIRDGIELLQAHGAGPEIRGHRDGYATSCPGGPLYAWVQRGAPRPTTKPPTPAVPASAPEEDDMPTLDEIRVVIRQEIDSALSGRKADLAHEVLFWADQATRLALGQGSEDPGEHPLKWVVPSLADHLRQLAAGGLTPDQIKQAVASALAAGIEIDGTITTKGN